MAEMELEGKITEPDLNDVGRLMRSTMHWFKLLLPSWHGFALLGAIIWATVLGLMGRTKPNWRAVEIIWLVMFAILGWSFYRTKAQTAREFNELNAKLPDRISIVDEGIKLDGPNGAKASFPGKLSKRGAKVRQYSLWNSQKADS